MYEVKYFAENGLEVQHKHIEQHPLGLVICNDENGRYLANPIPFVLKRDYRNLGALKARSARANPQWGQLQNTPECLLVFQGEASYISPNWYPTKHENGKVVPTWNYVAIHVWGVPRVIDDPEWVRKQVDNLTAQQEVGQSMPWKIGDAPAEYTPSMPNEIIAIEIAISEIQGKWKFSQNRPVADIQRVHAGLSAIGEIAMADQHLSSGTPEARGGPPTMG